jgi:hypothetical protein
MGAVETYCEETEIPTETHNPRAQQTEATSSQAVHYEPGAPRGPGNDRSGGLVAIPRPSTP